MNATAIALTLTFWDEGRSLREAADIRRKNICLEYFYGFFFW